MEIQARVLWYLKVLFEVICSLFMVFYYLLKSWVRFFYVKRKNISDEIVLLTGAAGGVGTLLARKLSRRGCTLVLLDLNPEVKSLAESISDCGESKVFSFTCDITDRAEFESVADDIIANIGHPTMLINNAGTLSGKYFNDISHEDFVKTFQVNKLSHYTIIHKFLPYMLQRNHGHIVSISSVSSLTPAAGTIDYASSKAAATSLMHSIRQELRYLGKTNIHCTNVLPFQIRTKLFEGCESRFPNFPGMCVQEAEYVAEKIMEAIEKNKVTVYIPRVLYLMSFLYQVLPSNVFDVIIDFFRINQAMQTHVGHKGSGSTVN